MVVADGTTIRRGGNYLRRERLASTLREAVLRGKLQSGQVIPTESELMEEHNLSRHGVRSVLNTLASEGLISRKPGRGTVVCASADRMKTRLVSLVVQEPHEWLASGITSGLSEVFRHESCRLELVIGGDTQNEFNQTIEDLLHNPTDGVIVLPLPWLTNHEWVFKLKQANIPLVTVDTYPTGTEVDSVEVDNHLGGYLAGKYLIERGYRRLYYASSQTFATTTQQRFEGILHAATEYDGGEFFCLPVRYQLDDSAKREHRYPWKVSQRFWRDFLADKLDKNGDFLPVGIFTVSDIEAYGIVLASKELGLRIGTDIGIIGFGDSDLALLSDPPLTSLAYHPKQVGQEAAKLLLKRLDNSSEPIEHIRIPPELVKRNSA